MERRPNKSDLGNGLTPIHPRIHCAATKDSGGDDQNDDLERLQVEHFLNTLAQIALAVAARSVDSDGGDLV